jgi:hypothetical protein
MQQKNEFLIDLEITSFLARQKFAELLFKGSEYGRVAIDESFDKITYGKAVEFIEEHFIEAPFQMFVSGCISENSKNHIQSFIKDLPIVKSGEKRNYQRFQFIGSICAISTI